MVQTKDEARAYRQSLERLALYAPEGEAVKLPSAYPRWSGAAVAYTDGSGGEPQSKVRGQARPDLLYKCISPHTSQEGWEPSQTPALWAVVDETHAGTLEDPIPAARGMEYFRDKHYLDPNGKTYLCIRDSDADPGAGIVLQYLPSELVGTYFEEVENA